MTSSSATPGRVKFDLSSQSIAMAALLVLPAALVIYFAFSSGGFFPGPPALGAVILCVVLLVRALAGNPFEGIGWPGAIVTALLSLYTLLTLVSQHWSHSPGLALESFDRALLYLLVFVLFTSLGGSGQRIGWMVRALATTITGICVCAVITRMLPRVWPIGLQFASSRLSFPITYWNALGLFAGFGIILCVHLSSDRREYAAIRILAAAAIPMLATTLYFTLSRGAIGATLIGLVVYLVAGRPRLWASTAITAVPTSAIAVKVAYDAGQLTSAHPTSAHAVSQGHHVAVILLICVVDAAVARALFVVTLDRLWRLVKLPGSVQRRFLWIWWPGIVVVVLVLVAVFHGRIDRGYHDFKKAGTPTQHGDLRTRLTSVVNDNRLPLWRVAWREFKAKPVLGQGAGTFENSWDRYGTKAAGSVVNAHSLYLENLDELGIVGAGLLVAAILTMLAVTAIRIRGPNRPLLASVFAVLIMWALHAGFDWDWQMPVVTLVFFALGGVALARPHVAATAAAANWGWGASSLGRTLIGIGCCVLAVAPAYMWLSQRHIDAASAAFVDGECHQTTSASLAAISVLGSRPEPYSALGYCDILGGRPKLALAMMHKAIQLDPEDWNYRYGLAIIQASAGLNPLPAARAALRLYPAGSAVQAEWRTFHGSRSRWTDEGYKLAQSVNQF
jgi:hypothetical protein